mmetsp:Transcript_49557/g.92837  ORF Transcript_49557/g.92837 Transcript_49557/m.92837 type:complete len:109 (+) Transcript_49557:1254-1580(+)
MGFRPTGALNAAAGLSSRKNLASVLSVLRVCLELVHHFEKFIPVNVGEWLTASTTCSDFCLLPYKLLWYVLARLPSNLQTRPANVSRSTCIRIAPERQELSDFSNQHR